MKKNIFEVAQEEKNRILGLHESATKNLYLNEDLMGDRPFTEEEIEKGEEIWSRITRSENLSPKYWGVIANKGDVNPLEYWADKECDFPPDIVKAFGDSYHLQFITMAHVNRKDMGRIGRFFMKNPSEMTKVNDILNKSPQQMMDMLHQRAKIE